MGAGGRGQKLVKIANEYSYKTSDMGKGGVKNSEKLPTSFMDVPYHEKPPQI